MTRRQQLQDLLVQLLGSKNVYFQPPPNVVMRYPCIVYRRDFIQLDYADDFAYKKKKRYQVTVIDSDPDSVIHERLSELPMCSYDRFFTADNLNHDVYNLFF